MNSTSLAFKRVRNGANGIRMDKFTAPCKLGTVPALVWVHGKDQIEVGKWVRIKECEGDTWHSVFVDKINEDGYFFASR